MPVLYPYNRNARGIQFQQGNFGLFHTKYVVVCGDEGKDFCKACDESGSVTNAVQWYGAKYSQMKRASGDELAERHQRQKEFLRAMEKKYKPIELRATLISPLLTGVGYPHPSETSLIFEHNLGIPYIPASSVKGIVRFAFTLGLLEDAAYQDEKYYGKDDKNKKYFKEELTPIGEIFGWTEEGKKKSEAKRGSVIFLDAYPEKVPDLVVDILNPHYPDYYGGKKPPADNQNPVPIKFLAVAKGTVFVFRAVVKKGDDALYEMVKNAYIAALCEEGVGAKTAVGYGRFTITPQSSTTKGQNNGEKIQTVLQTTEDDIEVGKIYEAKVLGVTPDGGSIQVELPQGRKAIISKKQFPKDIQANLKQFCQKTKILRVEVVAIKSGNVSLKLAE